MRKVVHDKAREYLKNLRIASERLHVHGNKQLLPRTRTDIFNTRVSFSGSLAWNSLPYPFRYPMEVKTFKRKAFQALTKPPWYLFLPFSRHLDTKCIEDVFTLACSCQVLRLYFTKTNLLSIFVFSCVIVLSFTFLVVIILMLYICVCATV